MENNITKFAILGERCTGTNFFEEAISQNFNITYTAEYGNKHFYCYNNYKQKSADSTLFIGIVRNPIYWINSFSKEQHHIPSVNKNNLKNFLFNEFYSVEKVKEDNLINGNTLLLNKNPLNNTKEVLNIKDLNYLNGKTYKNIFELRKIKQDFLINIMPTKVKNFILINYEDLLYNYETTLDYIKEKYKLIMKHKNFIKILKYKKSATYNFVKQREITFSLDIIKLIWSNLNMSQENSLGYFPFNNNNYFIEKFKTKNNEENDDDAIDNKSKDKESKDNESKDNESNNLILIENKNIVEETQNYIYKKMEENEIKSKQDKNFPHKKKKKKVSIKENNLF